MLQITMLILRNKDSYIFNNKNEISARKINRSESFHWLFLVIEEVTYVLGVDRILIRVFINYG